MPDHATPEQFERFVYAMEEWTYACARIGIMLYQKRVPSQSEIRQKELEIKASVLGNRRRPTMADVAALIRAFTEFVLPPDLPLIRPEDGF